MRHVPHVRWNKPDVGWRAQHVTRWGFVVGFFPLPANEEERLEEILGYDFHDRGPEDSLEQICVVARALFAVPMALVTLVGRDEQTFLAKCGIDADGTSRKDAFCTYTILEDDVFVVEDATRDERFVANPLVTGAMHVRFYAGAPLILRSGIRVGALCLIGTEPRQFTADDAARLQGLARLAVNELRHRRTLIDLQRERELLSQTARMTKVGSWSLDLRARSLAFSMEAYRILEVEPTVRPTLALVKDSCAPAFATVLGKGMDALIERGVPFDENLQIITLKGSTRWVRCLAEAERNTAGEIVRLIGSLQDVTLEHDHATEIERLAYLDTLTGLPNRALFQKNFTLAIEDAHKDGSKVGLVMIDLDHFKDVNDALGHDAGDALLKSVSEQLQATYRKSDTISRLGGDEFAVILPGVRSMEDLTRPTEALLERLRHPVEHDGKVLSITASVGVTLYPHDDQSPGQLMKDADIALYRAKSLGRNRVVRFETMMRDEVETRIKLLSDVRRGIDDGQFALFYQPLVSLAAPRQVVGFEALMRWHHPKRGVLGPVEFLPALEDQDLSLALGAIALDRAMLQMRAWIDGGVPFGRVAVNLSASQFRTGDLAETVAAKLSQHGVSADRLTLEVTESVYMGWGSTVVAETITALHHMGVSIALDDFGTGYASLSNLNHFPIDRLKIDKSFIHRDRDWAIVRAVVTLGASMGMKVVAEGVETERQAANLESIGCDQAQGYYFARPMPPHLVSDYLADFESR